jgi:hypothetical protein
MFCGTCGTRIAEGYYFCTSCGRMVHPPDSDDTQDASTAKTSAAVLANSEPSISPPRTEPETSALENRKKETSEIRVSSILSSPERVSLPRQCSRCKKLQQHRPARVVLI